MEQKKTLWIIAAVGVFLLVVIGAALILYSPTQTVESSIASLQVQNDTWTLPNASGKINQSPSSVQPVAGQSDVVAGQVPTQIDQGQSTVLPPVSEPVPSVPGATSTMQTVDGMTVYSGTTNVYGTGTTTIDLNALKYNAPSQTSAVTPENQAAANVISSTASTKAASVQEQTAAVATKPAASTAKSSATSAVATTKETTSSAKSSAAKSASSSSSSVAKTSSTAKPASVSTKLPDQYWVQAASFSSKNNAEEARAALSANKIESEIFTYTDSNGKVYYRLRVGPYTTKTEAEYWRSRIVLIDEFADSQSYVTNSSAKKS